MFKSKLAPGFCLLQAQHHCKCKVLEAKCNGLLDFAAVPLGEVPRFVTGKECASRRHNQEPWLPFSSLFQRSRSDESQAFPASSNSVRSSASPAVRPICASTVGDLGGEHASTMPTLEPSSGLIQRLQSGSSLQRLDDPNLLLV